MANRMPYLVTGDRHSDRWELHIFTQCYVLSIQSSCGVLHPEWCELYVCRFSPFNSCVVPKAWFRQPLIVRSDSSEDHVHSQMMFLSTDASSVISELVVGFIIPGRQYLDILWPSVLPSAQSVFLLRQPNRDDDVGLFVSSYRVLLITQLTDSRWTICVTSRTLYETSVQSYGFNTMAQGRCTCTCACLEAELIYI